ncbi:hypothetical protein AEYBE204_11585 [Asticcacaulis sp. YBE204]|nr:hypothetical protein AEYBE204_11585 [Asticcacaulis sp. YBE204]
MKQSFDARRSRIDVIWRYFAQVKFFVCENPHKITPVKYKNMFYFIKLIQERIIIACFFVRSILPLTKK